MAEQNGSARRGYLLFVWSPTGYSLREQSGEVPRVGDEVEEGLVVTKVGSSPLPRDTPPPGRPPPVCVLEGQGRTAPGRRSPRPRRARARAPARARSRTRRQR